MEKLHNNREVLTTKEMSSIFGGATSWTCTRDTAANEQCPCGDTETYIVNDEGETTGGWTDFTPCPKPQQAYCLTQQKSLFSTAVS